MRGLPPSITELRCCCEEPAECGGSRRLSSGGAGGWAALPANADLSVLEVSPGDESRYGLGVESGLVVRKLRWAWLLCGSLEDCADRADTLALPDHGGDWGRRHGRGVSGDRYEARARGGAEGIAG